VLHNGLFHKVFPAVVHQTGQQEASEEQFSGPGLTVSCGIASNTALFSAALQKRRKIRGLRKTLRTQTARRTRSR
jgi:hypothetical protein